MLWWSGKKIEEDFELPELIEPTDIQTKVQQLTQDLVTNIPVQFEPKTSQDLEEVEFNQIQGTSDDSPMIDLDKEDGDGDSDDTVQEMARSVARSKVREARLKAKIARLKAERSTEKYLNKYGATYSDLDDSESEVDTQRGSDTEDDEDSTM